MTSPGSTRARPRRLACLGVLATGAMLDAGRPPGAGPAAVGTIRGRIVLDGPAPAPKTVVAKGDPRVKDDVCKQGDITDKDLVVDPATKGVANGFAYLVNPTGDWKAAEEAYIAGKPIVVIREEGCEFLPYATVVHKDQKLGFKSSDPVGHNVRFSSFGGRSAQMLPSLGMPPRDGEIYTFTKKERLPTAIFCDIHPWMKGYFFVVDHPFAVVTKADGSFEIPNVPAGTQQLVIWQGSKDYKGFVNEGGNKGMPVTVKAGETTDVGALKVQAAK